VPPSPQLLNLERGFPRLASAGYNKTSDKSPKYNCIAWAAEDTQHGFWWPQEDTYWPFWIRREDTVKCFVRTFRSLGYSVCTNARRQPLFHKVALYAIHKTYKPMPVPDSLDELADWDPTHMARQLPDGSWTSKCGGNEDITHFTLDALDSYGLVIGQDQYGCAVLYMRRFVLVSFIVRAAQRLYWKFGPCAGICEGV
jgi:hypothetical protein